MARRLGGGGATAARSSAISRASAASRFCNWLRCSLAATVTVPSTSLPTSRSRARTRRCSGSDGDRATSNESSARLSVVLTPCPPGPDEREKRQDSSASGTLSRDVTCSGPGMPTSVEQPNAGQETAATTPSILEIPMNEPQHTVQSQHEVPPPSDSSTDEVHPAQKPAGDDDGMQAGWETAAPAPDLDDPSDQAKDDQATDSANT